MTDWATVASLATAGGTLILAIATFASVRSAHRAARVAEYSMQIGIRPLLLPSRLDAPTQKIMWGDEHWASLAGGQAVVETVDANVYLAMSLRNSGSGIAVVHGWHLGLQAIGEAHPHAEPDEFRPQTRDLYVPGGDIGFWQAAMRGPKAPSTPPSWRPSARRGCSRSRCSTRTTRAASTRSGCSSLAPMGESRWLCSMVRHWNLDRPDPR